jgi:hypothetical protein
MDKEIHCIKRNKEPSQELNSAKLPAKFVTFLGQLITPSNPKVISGTERKMGAQSLGQKLRLTKRKIAYLYEDLKPTN